MITENRSNAFDPFLTTHAQLNLVMAAPSPMLLIDGDDLIVTNALDRTDDPAVLISGNRNVFVNETGATLSGTGTGDRTGNLDGAIEISGTGNEVQNQVGAVVTGVNGIVATGSGTTVVNAGDVLTENIAVPFSSNSTAIGLGVDSDVRNSGLVRAEASFIATGITVADGGVVDNSGVVEAAAEFSATGIAIARDGLIVNSGDVSVSALSNSVGLLANSSGGSVQNFGSIHAMLDSSIGNAFGIASVGDNTIWNGGTVEAISVGGGNTQGIVAFGGSVVNEGAIVSTTTVASPEWSSIGIFLSSANALNSGTVTATTVDGGSIGVVLSGEASFANTNEVLATGKNASGVVGDGILGSLTNSGTIAASAIDGVAAGVNLGAEATIANDGIVLATGSEAVGARVGNLSNLTNSGTITAIGVDVPAAGPLGATAINVGNSATVRNDGLAEATGVAAIGINAGADGTIVNSGDIIANGLDASGVVLADGEFTNTGTVSAVGPRAKGMLVRGDAVIVNDGAIIAVSDVEIEPSVGIWFETNEFIQKTIVNTGTIDAEFAIFDGTAHGFPGTDLLTLENSGLIAGEVILGNAVDEVFNSGTINGNVDLGDGDDLFDGRGGQIDGTVSGGFGNDILIGGDGNDILIGGDGADTITGGAGADVIDGGASFDTLDYSASAAGVQVNLGDASLSTSAPVRAGAGTGFGGDAEGDTFQGIEKVIGSSFNDFVYGSQEGNIVELGDGNDVFDNRSADSGNDVVDLGAGNDVARAGAGDDLVFGGAGRDWLFGEDGHDILLGQDGRDVLVGGLGDDRLDGGGGNDLLAGGGGNDLFTFGLDGGNDRIFGFEAGVGSDDAVDLTAFNTILSFDDVLGIATQTGGDDDDDDDDGRVSTVLTFDADTTLTFTGVRLADLNEADFILI